MTMASKGKGLVVGLALAALCGVYACDQEGDGAGGATAASSTSTTSSTGASTVASTTGATTSASSGGGAACEAAKSTLPGPCGDCLDGACAPQWAACCDATMFDAMGTPVGCVGIAACGIETGCVHAACYQDSTCKKPIDDAGGLTTPSLGPAGSLADCVRTSTDPACIACANTANP